MYTINCIVKMQYILPDNLWVIQLGQQMRITRRATENQGPAQVTSMQSPTTSSPPTKTWKIHKQFKTYYIATVHLLHWDDISILLELAYLHNELFKWKISSWFSVIPIQEAYINVYSEQTWSSIPTNGFWHSKKIKNIRTIIS